MKKLLSLLLATAIVLSASACGKSDSTGASSADSGKSAPVEKASSSAEKKEEKNSSSTDYITYDDLPRTEKFWVRLDDGGEMAIEIDYPDIRFDTYGNGMGSENSLDYTIIAVNAENSMPDTSLEDAFLTLLNGDGGFHSVLRGVNRSTYSEMTPETEEITLECGKAAVKFTGIQHRDDYGTVSECPVYGYCTLCDDAPVIVCYLLFNEEAVDDATRAELAGYVDEMINTVRICE